MPKPEPPPLEWNDLRVFLAVARLRTLGAAARELGQTQPTMGRRLRALETALGQTLFQRTRTGLVLTDEGQAMLAPAERMEAEAHAIERRLAGGAQRLEGRLRVTASDWFGAHLLAPVLAEFATLHPAVELELITDSRFLNLSRREADLAFRIRRFTEADIVSRKFLHVRYGAYVRCGMEVFAQDGGRNLAVVTLDRRFGDRTEEQWLRQMLPHARIAVRCNSRDAQARLCAEGLGLALLPVVLGERTGGLVRLDLGREPPGRDTWVGYHRDLRRQARLRALLDLLDLRLAS